MQTTAYASALFHTNVKFGNRQIFIFIQKPPEKSFEFFKKSYCWFGIVFGLVGSNKKNRMKHLKNLIFAMPVAAFLIMGCNATKSQKGAVIGGTAGAVGGTIIGKAAGNKTLGTIIGAAVGGTAGAIIGRDMDKQAEDIKTAVPNANVERVDEGIRVEFNEKILFEFSKADLGAAARKSLNDLVTILNKYPNTNIEVQGHTDSRGTDEYNMGLSERRAQSVANYLISQGIATDRITTKGFGESAPAYTNDTQEGMAQNRRVEFLITANEAMKEQAKKEAQQQ